MSFFRKPGLRGLTGELYGLEICSYNIRNSPFLLNLDRATLLESYMNKKSVHITLVTLIFSSISSERPNSRVI
jgi:hypothetical protein